MNRKQLAIYGVRQLSSKGHLIEYISRRLMCQIIYRQLENIKRLAQEKYDAAVHKYPILGQLYTLLKEFNRIMFSKKAMN